MKKYLFTSAAALAFCGLFTSCTHDFDNDGGSAAQNSVMKTYEQAFITAFGQPDPNQEWGFGPSVATSRAMTRSLGDYDNYKGSLQPFVWGNDPNDNNQWKQMPYTFPSAPTMSIAKPTNATYYSGNSELKLNGETYWMDENTDGSYIDIKTHGDFYIVKSGTGEGNVTIAPPSWYVGNVDYGYKIRVFVCSGVTFKIPTNGAGNLQANVEYYFAPGANLICDASIKLNGTSLYIAGNTTAPQLEVNNSGIFYNMGTANITNDISVENSSSTIVNDGTLNAKNLLTKGSGRVQNNAELTISNTTTINSNYNVWVNNGYYKTKYFKYTATSSSVINNCFLEVTEDFFMNISDGSGDFKIDTGGGVLTKNFYGGGVYGDYNGGPFKITMGSRSVFKVTNEAHLNALASGIASNHYGFEGVGSEYAVFQANKVMRDGLGEGNVAYSGKLYVAAEDHFAQGYSGQYPYIHYYNNCSEANIYAPGFQSGTPDITIATTPCNPGFGDDPGPDPDAIRVICEDLSVTQASDWDFNDVVFDIQLVENDTQVEITLRAAGGTLRLCVGDLEHEVHELFAAADPSKTISTTYPCSMINTLETGSKYNVKGCKKAVFRLDIQEDWRAGFEEVGLLKAVAKNMPVKVYKMVNTTNKEYEWITIDCKRGDPAAKIAVGTDYNWCDERTSITDVFLARIENTERDFSTFKLYVKSILGDDWYTVKKITQDQFNKF